MRMTPTARALRRRATIAETLLWSRLRNRGLHGAKFRRQVPVGPFVADFLCAEAKFVVEVDGGQHAQSETDAARDAWLGANGYAVARYWNNDVLGNIEGVLEDIAARLADRGAQPLTPTLSPKGRGSSAHLAQPAQISPPLPRGGEGRGEGGGA